jgi:uncharacterized membrane protein YqiK
MNRPPIMATAIGPQNTSHDRDQAEDRGRRREQDGTQTMHRRVDDGRAAFHAGILVLLDLRHQHDRVADDHADQREHAEHGDEPERPVEQQQRERHADDGQRRGEHHQQEFLSAVELQHQDEQHQQEHHGDDGHDGRRSLGALAGRAAHLDAIARR